MRSLKAVAIAGALALTPMAASALTVVSPGGSYNIDSDTLFSGSVDSAPGGAGSYFVEFYDVIGTGPTDATATASVTVSILGTFTNLMMSWVDSFGGDAGTVLASGAVTAPGDLKLTTNFAPTHSMQYLMFTWDDSEGASFDFDVSTIPVPAGGVLLLTALGGLGLARRKQRKAA